MAAAEPVRLHGKHGFFWLRQKDGVTLDTVARLISSTQFDSFHIHHAPDGAGGGFDIPADWKREHVTVSQWFESSEQYTSLLRKKNIYFAPRAVEGIGFSFLEAMGLGHCVVASDFPTMSEYLAHGVTGLLYAANAPEALCFDEHARIGMQAWESVQHGRKLWENAESAIIDYILTPNKIAYAQLQTPHLPARMSLKRLCFNLYGVRRLLSLIA